MKVHDRGAYLRRTSALTAAVAGIVFAAGATAGKHDGKSTPNIPYEPSAIAASDAMASGFTAEVVQAPQAVQVPGLYIVQLVDPPVSQYRGGESSIGAIPRLASRGGRLDVRSTEALQYADLLQQRQQAFVDGLSQEFLRPVGALRTYQFAFNGVVAKLGEAELAHVRSHKDVRMVEPVTALPLNTDVGPGFIGAPDIWNGVATGGEPGTLGEGVVIGVIDSGVNWESPSFADVGDDAFDHNNPLGSGNYLGVCATETPDADIGPNCNDKLIGAYANSFDFVQQVNFECDNPGDPGNELGLDPSICANLGWPLLDYDNALDENGHGSHTASTAGGNVTDINFLGNPVTVSGVAPHANIIAYDTCHTRTTGANAGGGSCFNIATLAAIEQVVQDGIVDVINYSIGGGASPWTESNSQAFLAATDAGVFVAASAGNSGPGPGTLGHLEPWVASSGASTHTRGAFNFRFSAGGDMPAPASVTNQPLFLGTVGGPHDSAFVDSPLVISPGIDTTDDGCAAFAADAFLNAVAVIRRGSCAFSLKATNAEAAGAIGVIIANNTTGNIAPGISPAVPFPVFGATQVQGNDLRDYVASLTDPGTATVSIPLAAAADAVQGDVMAGFSSRGPSAFDALKPDVTNPGVNILAAYVGEDPGTATGASDPNGYNTISGTSMSSPHTAGSAALIRAVHPDWTVAEIKSALMLTSNRTGITKEDGITAADPFDRGAGRVNLSFAAETGLVMDETPLQMFQADPAEGGDPSSLNLASLQSSDCVGTCSWTRRVRSVASGPVTYDASFATSGDVTATVTPSSFTINPGQTVTLEIEADVSAAAAGQFHFGDVVLTPDVAIPTLHLPMAVFSVEIVPQIELSPASVGASVIEGGAAQLAQVTIANTGFADLNWAAEESGQAVSGPLYSQLLTLADNPGSGFSTGFYSSGGNVFLSDSFTLDEESGIGSLYADGFVFAATPDAAYQEVSFFVYPDAGGQPNGDPQTSPGNALFSFTATIGDAGLSVEEGPFGGSIGLDLPAAGTSLTLGAGKYWLIVAPGVLGFGAPNSDEWFWMGSGPNLNLDDQALLIDPSNRFGAGATNWTTLEPLLGNPRFRGLSMEVRAAEDCGAAWLSTMPTLGTLGASESEIVTLTLDPTGLAPGVYTANYCVSSNDPATPLASVPVTLTVEGIQTDPAVVGAATPDTLDVGEATLITATVTAGTNPESTGLVATADLTSIGGSASQVLYDDGTNGDAVAGDNVFSLSFTVQAGTPYGETSISVSVTDDQARVDTDDVDLLIRVGGDLIFRDGFED